MNLVQKSNTIRPAFSITTLIVLFVVCCFFRTLAGVQQAPANDPFQPAENGAQHHVLLLNSYHQGFLWTDEIVSGVKEAFANTNITFSIEYMDSKRLYDNEAIARLTDLLVYKHSKQPYDLIITSDNNAFDFIKSRRARIFGTIPVVFCGVNYVRPVDITPLTNVTGINEAVDIAGNLALIRRLHPDCDRILFIVEDTPTGKPVRAEVERLAAEQPENAPSLEIIQDVSWEELADSLNRTSPPDVILLSIFFRDRTGRFREYDQHARFIAENTTAPVYACWDFHLGHGVVGGNLVEGFGQGFTAAQYALRILNGENPDHIPVLYETPTHIVLDYPELIHHGITLSSLPENARIVHQPQTFYTRYCYYIWGAALFTGLLSALLILAIINILRKRTAQQEIMEIAEKLRITLYSIGDAVIAVDTRTRITNMNPMAEKLTGWKIIDAQGKPLTDIFTIINAKSGEVVENPITKNSNNLSTMALPKYTRLIAKDGAEYQISGSVAPIRGADGNSNGQVLIFRDMTESYAKEEALRRSALFNEALLEAIPTPVFFKDREGKYLGCNRAFTEMMGVTPNEIRGKTVWELWPSEHSETYHRKDIEVMEKPCHQVYEFKVKDKTGNIRPVIFAKDVFRDPDGQVAGVVGAFLDITQQEAAKAELQSQKDRIAWILEGTNVGTWEWNVQTGELILNERWAGIISYTLDEISPVSLDTWTRYAHPEDLKESWRLLQECFEHKTEYYHFECRMKHKNGEWIWVLDRGKVGTWTEDGKPEWMYGTHQDITARKQAETDLKKAHTYITNILDSMPSLVIGVDTEGNITQWNSAAARQTGISSEEALGNSIQNLLPGFRIDTGKITRAIRTRQQQVDLKRARKQDGETLYEDITIYPLITNGVEGAVIRVDNVTERVRIEEIMVQSEKMLSVGGLAAGMAHEINNPLGGMIQTAEVMNNRLTELEMPANIRAAEAVGINMSDIAAFMEKRGILDMLKRMRQSGNRAAEIVSNMLSFARKGNAIRSKHNLAELLDQCVDLAGADYDLKKKFDFRQIGIIREYEKNLPPVPCEAGKIQQVILNILRNGAEAMREKPVEEKEYYFTLRLSHNKAAGMVRMEIEDNGPGMDEATRKRVFEPFFTTKPTDRGTGLGLSVSYFIITENHNGKMMIESQPGEGARFIICLPLNEEETDA